MVSAEALLGASGVILGACCKQGFGYNSHMGTIDIASLSFEERLRLVEQIWESLTPKPEAVPLTHAQHQELDRRLDELDREGPSGIPWDEVLRQIRSRAR
jgi:putative addiction module component (TIGR02574 family)